jgi:hypothetical protein
MVSTLRPAPLRFELPTTEQSELVSSHDGLSKHGQGLEGLETLRWPYILWYYVQ